MNSRGGGVGIVGVIINRAGDPLAGPRHLVVNRRIERRPPTRQGPNERPEPSRQPLGDARRDHGLSGAGGTSDAVEPDLLQY
jgi:hypothetical protein